MFTAALQSLDHSRAYRGGATVRLASATPCPPGIAQPGLRQALTPRSILVSPATKVLTATTRCRHLLHLAVVYHSLVITACRGRCTVSAAGACRNPQVLPKGPTDGHPGDRSVVFHPLQGEVGRCRRQASEGTGQFCPSVADDGEGADVLCQVGSPARHLRRGVRSGVTAW